ncbi:hypothetical protein D3C87_1525180 [compost metagenome]
MQRALVAAAGAAVVAREAGFDVDAGAQQGHGVLAGVLRLAQIPKRRGIHPHQARVDIVDGFGHGAVSRLDAFFDGVGPLFKAGLSRQRAGQRLRGRGQLRQHGIHAVGQRGRQAGGRG